MDISVIIPVYNGELYLQRAIESALMQKEVNQLVLIDDGSTDSSLSICKEYLQDERVKILQHDNGINIGVAASRNLGIKKATSEYIAFLDADDYYLKDRFLVTEQIFRSFPDCDAVYECLGIEFLTNQARELYLKNGKTLKNTTVSKPYKPEDFFAALVSTENVSFDTITIKRKCFTNHYMFDETMKQTEDTDLLWRLADKYVFRSGEIVIPVAIRLVHGENSILNKEESVSFKKILLKRWFEKIRNNQWPSKANFYLAARYARSISNNKVEWGIQFLLQLIKKPWLLFKFF